MPPMFDIIQGPSGLCFTGNLEDIVLKRLTTTASTVKMTVSFDGVVYCQNTEFYYDSTGFIRIRTRDMVKGLICYKLPNNIEQLPFTDMSLKFIDESGFRKNVTAQLIEGGVPPQNQVGGDWWQQNFLTWQPQIVKMPEWQPQWLTVIKPSYGPKAIRIIASLYTEEGTAITRDITTITTPGLTRLHVSYWQLWRRDEEFVTPTAYDIYGIALDDPAAPNESGKPNSPYVQRYELRPTQLFDRCFIFQNSLGGFDSVMATGISTYIPTGDSNIFVNNGEESEITGAYSSVWEQNTGYIPDSRTVRQWHEFLNSTNRYLYIGEGNIWQKIVVDEYDVKDKTGVLSSYTFKYHLTRPDESTFYLRKELPAYPRSTKFFTR